MIRLHSADIIGYPFIRQRNRLFSLALHLLAQPVRLLPRRGTAARRLLFVGRHHLGDMLLLTPGVAALKSRLPGLECGVMGAASLENFVLEGSDFDFYVPEEEAPAARDVAAWRTLFRRREIDGIAAVRGRTAQLPPFLAAALAGLPVRIGPGAKGFAGLATHAFWEAEAVPIAESSVRAARALVPDAPLPATGLRPVFRPPALPAAPHDVVISPYAQHAMTWKPEYWADLLRALTGAGRSAVVVGKTALPAIPFSHPRVDDRTNRTGLEEMAALVAASRLHIGLDTGTRHLANAFGVPSITLGHGIEARGMFGSYCATDFYYRHEVPCAPCGLALCRYGHIDCVRLTTPEVVAAKAEQILRGADRS